MLCSVAALPLFYRVGRRLGGTGTGLIAMGLAALAPGLIYYAAEGKQYVVDAAVAALLLDAGLAALDREMTPRRAAGLALLGGACLWFSHPSVVTLAGVGTSLFVAFVSAGRRREAGLVVAAAMAWLAVFAVEYLVQLRALRGDEMLVTYWSRGYLNFPPRSVREVSKYFLLGFGAFGVPFDDYAEGAIGDRSSLLALALWAAGLAVLAAGRRRAAMAMLLAPAIVATCLSMAGRYPLANRMILFLAATILPTMAAGLGGLIRSAAPSARWAGLALLVGTLLPLVEHESREALKGRGAAGQREVFAKVARDWRDGDLLVLNWASLAFYRQDRPGPGPRSGSRSPHAGSATRGRDPGASGRPAQGPDPRLGRRRRQRPPCEDRPDARIFLALDASARRLDAIESGRTCREGLCPCR